jgi:hypothetical protein
MTEFLEPMKFDDSAWGMTVERSTQSYRNARRGKRREFPWAKLRASSGLLSRCRIISAIQVLAESDVENRSGPICGA